MPTTIPTTKDSSSASHHHSSLWKSFPRRIIFWIIGIISFICLSLYYYNAFPLGFERYFLNFTSSHSYSKNYFQEIEKDFHNLIPLTKLKGKVKYSIFHIPNREILLYLIMLQNSIEMMDVPITSDLEMAAFICKVLNYPSFITHFHSLEVQIPFIIERMTKLSEKSNLKSSSIASSSISSSMSSSPGHMASRQMDLFHIEYKKNYHPLLPSLNNMTIFQTPLFYYVKGYYYSNVYCSKKRKRKEDWTAGNNYLYGISKSLVSTFEWKRNYGIDYIFTLAPPKSEPGTLGPFTLNEFARQTFLREDYDIRGRSQKDIIVPYSCYFPLSLSLKIANYQKKASSKQASNTNTQTVDQLSTGLSTTTKGNNVQIPPNSYPRQFFLFFTGGDHPKGGLRYRMDNKIQEWKIHQEQTSRPIVDPDRIIFSLTAEKTLRNGTMTYYDYVLSSEFCLHLRGDTTSSHRIFELIALGCIPVIISDFLVLPFESLIDYSKFSLRFPESIVHDIPKLLTTLKKITDEQKIDYYNSLLEAKDLLLFQQPHTPSVNSNPQSITKGFQTTVNLDRSVDHVTMLPLLNPTTLIFIEMIRSRLNYCQQFSNWESDLNEIDLNNQTSKYSTHSLKDLPFCYKLFQRRKDAKTLLSYYTGRG